MKESYNRHQNMILAVLYSVLLLLTVPCMAMATAMPTEYDYVSGSVNLSASDKNGITATVYLKESPTATAQDTVTITFISDGNFFLSGKIAGVTYTNITGTYNVVNYDEGARYYFTAQELAAAGLVGDLTLKVDKTNGRILGGTGSVAMVPVPTGAWLFGTGLMGFVGVRRKKCV